MHLAQNTISQAKMLRKSRKHDNRQLFWTCLFDAHDDLQEKTVKVNVKTVEFRHSLTAFYKFALFGINCEGIS